VIRFFKKIKQSGFTSTEAIIAAGIGSLVIVGGLALSVNLLSAQRSQESEFWIDTVQSDLLYAIYSDQAWVETISAAQNNTSMSCLRLSPSGDRQRCDLAQPRNIAVVSNGQVVFDATVASNGINMRGELCNQFRPCNPDPATGACTNVGDDRCPFRVNVSWQAVCLDTLSGSCLNPEPQINVQWEFNPGTPTLRSPFNISKYNVTFIRPIEVATIDQICRSVHGSLVASPGGGQRCILNPMLPACPPGEYPIGFRINPTNPGGPMQAVCRPTNIARCPAGQLFAGLNNIGEPVCRPGCAAAVNCQGNWGPCQCPGAGLPGVELYQITTPASGGGAACPTAAGATRACTCSGTPPPPPNNCTTGGRGPHGYNCMVGEPGEIQCSPGQMYQPDGTMEVRCPGIPNPYTGLQRGTCVADPSCSAGPTPAPPLPPPPSCSGPVNADGCSWRITPSPMFCEFGKGLMGGDPLCFANTCNLANNGYSEIVPNPATGPCDFTFTCQCPTPPSPPGPTTCTHVPQCIPRTDGGYSNLPANIVMDLNAAGCYYYDTAGPQHFFVCECTPGTSCSPRCDRSGAINHTIPAAGPQVNCF